MKKSCLSTLLAAALLAAGCSDNCTYDPETTPDARAGVPMLLTLTGGDETSRTTLDGQRVLWAAGDAIGLFSPDAKLDHTLPGVTTVKLNPKNARFEVSASGAGSATALFDPSADSNYEYGDWYWDATKTTHTFYAYYPYTAAALGATRADAVPFRLPNAQTQAAAGESGHIGALDLCYATARLDRPAEVTDASTAIPTAVDLRFRHTFALVRFEVVNASGAPLTLQSVKMQATGRVLSGDFTLDLSSGSLTPGQSADAGGSPVPGTSFDNVSVTLAQGAVLAAGAKADLYMLVSPADLSAAPAAITVSTSAGEQRFTATTRFVAGGSYAKRLEVDAPQPLYTLSTVDFEQAPLGADGTLKGNTLIGPDEYDLGNFYAYTEKGVSLRTYIGLADSWGYDWWCGFALSNHTDRTTAGFANDMSVYADGGHSGGKFAVAYWSDPKVMGPGYETQILLEGDAKVIDHLWIANTTYAVLAMRGDGAKALNYTDKDWFKLTLTGLDATGASTGQVEYYLADFRTPDAAGILEGWQKVDLATLGAVSRLQFDFAGTDTNAYGLLTPTYVCVDDIAVREPVQ